MRSCFTDGPTPKEGYNPTNFIIFDVKISSYQTIGIVSQEAELEVRPAAIGGKEAES